MTDQNRCRTNWNILAAAKEFYLDFLGFTLDFGGPTVVGQDHQFYGQVSRPGATLQLTEQSYEAGPGATVDIWITGVDDFRESLFGGRDGVLGPAVGAPPVEEVWWGRQGDGHQRSVRQPPQDQRTDGSGGAHPPAPMGRPTPDRRSVTLPAR